MRIKKYVGKSEQEIMARIKEELGSSAIILNVKGIKSNWIFRLFQKDKIEITAAVDRETDQLNIDEKELELKADQISHQLNNEKQENRTKEKMKALIYNHLMDQEVEREVATALLQGIDSLEDGCDIHDIIRIVYRNICQTIGTADKIDDDINKEDKPKVIFFIGPTGVGKTTSIAKLTADFSLRKQKKIALITADTYRIAAIDQLRTYAEILSVPLKVIYSTPELIEGIKQFNDQEFVFIDTAGRSHKNHEQLEELKEMLAMFPQKKVYLVLSATTKFKDLMSIITKYSALYDNYAIIITKTDETTSAGTIVNLKYYTNKSLSYVSFGQNVPDDIAVINGGEYAKMLLGSLGNE